jgi:hypothetical protein
MSRKVLAALTSLGLAACAPIAGDVGVGGTVVTGPVSAWNDPNRMWAAPGVQVYTGWNDPMFLVDNSWWWWNNGAWMWWGPSGWMWSQPPVVLSTSVRDPWRFRGWGTQWAGPRGGGVVRDHRGWSAPASAAPGNRPVGRQWNPSRSNGGVWTSPRGWGGGGPSIRDHRRR